MGDSPHLPLGAVDRVTAARLWTEYAAALPRQAESAPHYSVEQFGDHRALADELVELVVTGVKTATSSLLAEYSWQGETPPAIGAHTVFCTGDGTPQVITRTMALEIVEFDQVTAEFAALEGEGDLSLEYWRSEHTSFFERSTAALGQRFTPDMEILCERFVVVWPEGGLHHRLSD